ncbi:diacylglycerol O-acyltransferase [Actinoplanes ianthinogenes]|uniref:diacylglycerol O-acyltransferase n=1 Tax=Actinoplanes ianthinogenes TaxID=122358 RepID=A0ABN6CJE3_9ACTN|nr:wax ester/triacylglycerol synthase domain-containing protein [Actinoplanes ianthinogenes]BCJ44979.1 diacylglycerol O-acyltransferase [Actinoplanes ianthinogenes]GGR52598.1 diacylglycerol O-acyltransferase [Actinoplanes ianthinogenes]
MESRFPRLTAEDLINLAAESPDTPIHVAAVALLDGTTLLDPHGRPRLAEIRTAIESRLDRAPRLRQVIRAAGPFAGRPIWADALDFCIDDHVNVADLPAPGDERSLLRLTEHLIRPVLDPARPRWRMWLAPGLPDGGTAVVFVLHHAIADGMATIRLLTALLDTTPIDDDNPGETATYRHPQPAPRWIDLLADNLRSHAPQHQQRSSRAPRQEQPSDRAPQHEQRPERAASRAGSVRSALRTLAAAWRAPRTSLNVPLTPGRRLAVLRLPLADARTVAHRHSATVSDLILALATGGVRSLLLSRHEPPVRLNCSVAVSLRTGPADRPEGNRTGGLLVRLPVATDEAADRLRAIAAATTRAKREQSVATATAMLVAMARFGLIRRLSRRQRVTTVMESNMTGPATPIRLLGAPVRQVFAVGNLAGNVGLSVVALSYAGELAITVQAGADAFPDLPAMTTGMRRDWTALAEEAAAGDRKDRPGGRDGAEAGACAADHRRCED